MKKIEIIIAPDGSSEVKTLGFRGRECLQASQFLELTLGEKQSEKLTLDYLHQDAQDHLETRQQ